MTLKSSYEQIAINIVLIIAGKLKQIVPMSCFCDCEQPRALSLYMHFD